MSGHHSLASKCCGDKLSALSLITGIRLSFLTIVFLQLLTSIAQFTVMLNMTTFLTRACGMSDSMAGIIYGIYGVAAFFWSFLGGPILDHIGFKPVLIIATVVGTVGRVLIAYFAGTNGTYFSIPVFLAWGDSWIALGLLSAINVYVRNEGLRKIMFGITYSIMNVGAVAAGVIFDSQPKLPGLEHIMVVIDSTSQSIILIAAIPMFICIIITIFMPTVPIHKANDPTSAFYVESDESDSEAYANANTKRREMQNDPISPSLNTLISPEAGTATATSPEDNTPIHRYEWVNTLLSKDFWRVALFSISCMGARSIFLHLTTTFPTFMRRVYGNDAPIGAMYSINPIIIMALAPISQIILARMDTLKFLVLGTSLTTVSPLFLAFAAPHEMGLAAIIIFAVILSLGEAIWGPLSQFYVSQVAGASRIGTYMALLNVVTFAPKLPTGLISGVLLATYCPSDMAQPCHSHILWFIITATAASTPVFLALFVLFKIITPVDRDAIKEEAKEDGTDKTGTAHHTSKNKKLRRRADYYDDLDGYYAQKHSDDEIELEAVKQYKLSSSSGRPGERRNSSAHVSVYSSANNSPRVAIDGTSDIRLTRMKRSTSASSLIVEDMSD